MGYEHDKSSKDVTPDGGTEPSGTGTDASTVPATVRCSRCGNDVPPNDKYRCPICGVFLPGNPGNGRVERDMFDDWQQELIAKRGGADISIPDRLRIEAVVNAHRAIRSVTTQLRKVGAHSEEGKQLVATLDRLHVHLDRIGDIAPPSATASNAALGTAPTSVIEKSVALLERQLRGEILTPHEAGMLAAYNEIISGTVSIPVSVSTLADPSPEPSTLHHVTADEARSPSAGEVNKTARPGVRSPGSDEPPASDSTVSTVPATFNDGTPLDPDTRRVLFGETPEEVQERRDRATAVMFAQMGKSSPFLE